MTATIIFKYTDYRFNKNGESYTKTLKNVPFENVYPCLASEYKIFDRAADFVWVSYNAKTRTFTYVSKCYAGGANF